MNLMEMQILVRRFAESKSMTRDVKIRITDLVSEVGELCKEVLKGTEYGGMEFEKTDAWNEEMGDVLFSLICIANATDIDLETCLKSALDKYMERFKNHGSIGSDTLIKT